MKFIKNFVDRIVPSPLAEGERKLKNVLDKHRRHFSLAESSGNLSGGDAEREMGTLLLDGALFVTSSIYGFLALYGGDRFRIVSSTGFTPQEQELFEAKEFQAFLAGGIDECGYLNLSALSVMEKLPETSHGLREVPTILMAQLGTPESPMAGVICVGASPRDFSYTQDHVRALQSLAADAAVSFANLDVYCELKKSYYDVIFSLAKAMEASNNETYQHSVRVKSLVVRLARQMSLNGEFLKNLVRAAMLHDAGKIALPRKLINKPSSLSSGEWKKMRQHPSMAYAVVSGLSSISAEVSEMILHHHERWDGGGYPRGLKGEEIPLGARLLALAEAYDTMITPQPYRKAMTTQDALAEIGKCSGFQFDPAIVAALVSLESQPQESGQEPNKNNGSGR